ncbi:surface-adhesin E family protein, partial [Thauera linaloolentis]
MKPSRLAVLAMLIAMPLQEVLAADWQLVLSDRDRRVEIDRASIFSSDRGTKVSWGRVVLSNAEAASSGYATIKALNRYDCQNRTFVTVKRVYLDIGDNILREEAVADQAPLRVTPNSVDERMWREVCSPPSAADVQKVASEIQKLATAMQPAGGAAAAAPAKAAPAATPAGAQAPAAFGQAAETARPAPIEARDTAVRPIRTADVPPAPAPSAGDASQASIVPTLPRIRPPRPDPETLEREAPSAAAEPRKAGSPAPVAARPASAQKAEVPPRRSAPEAARPRRVPAA